MRKQTRENKYEKKTPDEESLIRHIRDQTASLVPSGFTGIGDDCAVLPLNAKESTLVSTDALVDGTHFLKEHITPEDLGHKALAVNLSDIAGMGGKAVGSFFSVGIPPETETAFLRKLLKGYRRLSEKYAVPLLGGDTVRSDKGLWLNITVIGTGAPKKIKLRSAAEEGDLICLNGPVGDAAAGLDLILASVAGEKADPQTGETPPSRTARLRPEEKTLIRRHYRPEPCLAEGQFLSRYRAVHAMMDLSDGLATDLPRLLRASGKTARIHMEKIPLSPELQKIAARQNRDPLDRALAGGEDYRLLFTIRPGSFSRIARLYREQFGHPLYSIGEILSSGNRHKKKDKNGEKHLIRWENAGKNIHPVLKKFRHFDQPDKTKSTKPQEIKQKEIK